MSIQERGGYTLSDARRAVKNFDAWAARNPHNAVVKRVGVFPAPEIVPEPVKAPSLVQQFLAIREKINDLME